MKVYLSTTVVGIALSAFAFSSSTTVAFLHFVSRSSKSPLLFNGIHHNNDVSKKENNHLSNLLGRTHLAYYPSDETLSDRLKNIQAEWDNVKVIQEGIKSITDELVVAEKILTVDAESAERGAIDVIEKGESDEYLLKPFAEGMVETGKILAKEMIEVRQEFDEVKASKIVEESTEGVARAFVLVEKDLEKIVENVVSSLQAAEKVVQSAIATMASVEGLTDTAKRELTDNLTDAVADVEESIVVADSVAKTAKRIAEEDQQVMSDLTKTGVALNNAIDVTKSIAQQFQGTEGGAEIDAVSNTVDQAASIVSEDLSAAESITDAVGEKVLVEADAVIAMDESVERSVAAIKAAKSSINDRAADNESIGEALSKDAKEIQLDEATAKQLAEVISKDTANDEDVLEVLERSSSEVKSLIDAVSDAVDKGETLTGMDDIEKKAKIVEKSVSNVERFTEKIKKEEGGAEGKGVIAEEEKVGLAENAPGDAMKDLQPENTIPPTSANDVKISEHDTMDVDSEIGKNVDEAAKLIPKVEKFAKKIEKDEGGAVEIKSGADTEQNLAEEKVGLACNEVQGDSQPESRILTTCVNDDEMFEHNTEDVDSAIAHANQGDAISTTVLGTAHSDSISKNLADTAVINGDPPIEFGVLLEKSGNVLSELDKSMVALSGTQHDVATLTREALTEVAGILSSLLSS